MRRERLCHTRAALITSRHKRHEEHKRIRLILVPFVLLCGGSCNDSDLRQVAVRITMKLFKRYQWY